MSKVAIDKLKEYEGSAVIARDFHLRATISMSPGEALAVFRLARSRIENHERKERRPRYWIIGLWYFWLGVLAHWMVS